MRSSASTDVSDRSTNESGGDKVIRAQTVLAGARRGNPLQVAIAVLRPTTTFARARRPAPGLELNASHNIA